MSNIQSIPYPSYTTANRNLLVVDNGFIINNTDTNRLEIFKSPNWYSHINSNFEITLDPTGFNNPENVIVTYNKIDRTITLTGTIDAYWRGTKISTLVSGWTSVAHNIAVDNYYLYYNGTNFIWSNSVWKLDMLQIAFISKSLFACRETHGLMDWQTHLELHQTIGCYRTGGADFTSYVLNSTTATNRRPIISETTLKDEDLSTILPALTNGIYTTTFLSGVNTLNYTLNSAEIISLTGNNPNYNKFNGTNWVQTPMSSNAYAAIFVMAAPVTTDVDSQLYRFQFIQPQTQSITLSTIQSLTAASINYGETSFLVPEFNVVAKIIIRYTGGNWFIFSVAKLSGTTNTAVAIQGGFLSGVTTTGLALSGQGTASNPLTILQRDGFMDYNHSGTTQSYTSGDLQVLNDGTGIYTLKTYKPLGITELWNTTTNQFNFSDLALGDEIFIRTDGIVTTTSVNQVFGTKIRFDIGGTPYDLPLSQSYFKSVGSYQVSRTIQFYIGNTGTLNNPAQLLFNSDDAATLQLTGFYISVKRRVN